MFNGKINEVMLECHSVSNIIRLCPITKWVTSWTYRYRNSKTRLQGLWTELPSSESIVFNTFSSVPSHCLPSQTQLNWAEISYNFCLICQKNRNIIHDGFNLPSLHHTMLIYFHNFRWNHSWMQLINVPLCNNVPH